MFFDYTHFNSTIILKRYTYKNRMEDAYEKAWEEVFNLFD